MSVNSNLGVEILEGHLSYGRGKSAIRVLRGINVRVPKGAIYGLLGPSGCGKTTLLNCIVSKYRLKDGSLRVFGKKTGSSSSGIPGRTVGFMPQETALYPEFTVEETLTYFARLHLIDSDAIKQRMTELLNLLDLPDKSRLVKNLSGGQQRRVSFAASIIHQPQLLILDEPTVGVDPLLRQSIWNYLVNLTILEGTTVIVTTHYIEEAKQANCVGFMREGRLLAEGAPRELMQLFNHSSLEDCFLRLCTLDKETQEVEVFPQLNSYGSRANLRSGSSVFHSQLPNQHLSIASARLRRLTESSYSEELPQKPQSRRKANACTDSFSKIGTLFWKNLVRLSRNIPVLLFQFTIPALQMILLCLCVGKPLFGLPVAVVNEEYPVMGSYHFLNALDDVTIIQNRFDNLTNAIDSVKRGENWGVIHIGRNLTLCLINRINLGIKVTDEAVDCGSIKLHMDMSNQQIGLSVQAAAFQAFQKFSKEMLGTMGYTPRIADLPIVVTEPIVGVMSVNYTEFIVPSVLVSIIYIMAVALTTMTFVQDRKSGVYYRSWISGVSTPQVLVSHVMTQFLVILVQVFGVVMFTFYVFNVPCRGPLVWVVVIVVLQGVCGMSFGLLISACVDEDNTAVLIAMGSFYPNLILGGVVWPIEGMSYFMRYFSYCLPQTLPIESVRVIISRGWDIRYSAVWSGCLVSVAWIVFYLMMAITIGRIRRI